MTVDRVTAASSTTFWTNLIGPIYDRTLWRNGLATSFSRAPRRDVHAAKERVKTLRNAVDSPRPARWSVRDDGVGNESNASLGYDSRRQS